MITPFTPNRQGMEVFSGGMAIPSPAGGDGWLSVDRCGMAPWPARVAMDGEREKNR